MGSAETLREIDAALPDALRGDAGAADRYARAWHELVLQLVDARPGAPASAVEVLDRLALTAPFDPLGPVHALVSVASRIIGDVDGSLTSSPVSLPASIDFDTFSAAVQDALAGSAVQLRSLLASWQLAISETARLFGVTRQAVQQWLDGGVPSSRLPKVLTVLRIADLLAWNVLPDRIPAIVRSPASGFGGATMLQLIARDRHDDLLASVARSFDWAATA